MKKVFFTVIFFLCAYCSFSQLIFDLADKKIATESIQLNDHSSILFKNLTPMGIEKNWYRIFIKIKDEEIPKLPSNLTTQASICSDQSQELQIAYASLTNEENEKKIPEEITNLKKLAGKLPANAECKNNIDRLINSTSLEKKFPFELRNNQSIVVTVLRINKNDTTTWEKTFKTPEKSPWKVMYGFTFVPNLLSKVDNYYSKATDATNQSYVITKFNNNSKESWENISPTIMFQWAPSSLKANGGRAVQLGIVGGLSLNFSKETGIANVLLGPSIIIAQNISISTGLIFTQKSVLRGKYTAGDIISENLDFDQLHEKKFMPETFISIAFRFDKNPFSGKDDSNKQK